MATLAMRCQLATLHSAAFILSREGAVFPQSKEQDTPPGSGLGDGHEVDIAHVKCYAHVWDPYCFYPHFIFAVRAQQGQYHITTNDV